ncbi:Pinin [Frankliniella fusca]|uniref:Pinin n=1 Tax=Frankliniella fusca TaxID=407009 RepID=A0AAE1HML3_9NEOP|nr:Pinin [Frankliniella fusca]
MATEVMKTFSALQEELLKAKEGLKDVDKNIKRIIGRDPEAQPPGQGPPRTGLKRPANQNDEFYGQGGEEGHPGRQMDEEGPPGLRGRLGGRSGTVFSRLSGPPMKYIKKERDEEYSGPPSKFYKREEEEDEMDEEEVQFNKPAISSRVIPQTRELPSKEDILAAQGDERSKARNRRMFGALLGTLQRFRQEETRMRDKEDKRATVEKKLEEQAKREKEEMKKERQELFHDRRRKQQEIRRIEFKIQRVKEQDEWEAQHRPLLNFIQTKAKPSIFYLPKIQNTKTEERLVASQKLIAKMMEKKRATVQEELERLEGNGNVQIKTENTTDHQFDDDEEEMDAENGPSENTHEVEDVPGESPAENKENRLRSINVKVEKDPDAPTSKAGGSEAEDKKPDGERVDPHRRTSSMGVGRWHQRDSRDQREQREPRDQRDHRDHRDQRDHRDRSRDRQRREVQHDRERTKDSETEREKGRERERGRERGGERERVRERERGTDREEKEEAKKEDEEKWDRKRDRRSSSETNAMEDDEEKFEEKKDSTVSDAPELSSISLPGEQSSPLHDDQDDCAD